MHLRFGPGISLTLLLLLVTMSEMMQQVHGRQKLCGEALNRALDLICVNGFSRRIKRDLKQTTDAGIPRSPTNNQDQEMVLRKWLDLLHESESERQRKAADEEVNGRTNGAFLRRQRRRIAHECCREGCTYDDIMDYCA